MHTFRLVKHLTIVLFISLLFCASCRGSSADLNHAAVPAGNGGEERIVISLPFPADENPLRTGKAVDQQLLLGKEYYRKSTSAIVQGDFIELPSSAGSHWGMYRFQDLTDSDVLQRLDISFDSLPQEYHLAIADFDSRRWKLLELGTNHGGSSSVDEVTWPVGIRATSPNGNVYVAVIHSENALVVLNSLQLTADINNNAPVALIQASSIRGNSSLIVEFDGSASYDKDGLGLISNYEWDWDGDGDYDDTGSSATQQHNFSSPGIYQVGLRVTDNNDGLSDTAQQEIRVLGWHHNFGIPEGESCTSTATVSNQVIGTGYGTRESGTPFDATIFSMDELGELLWYRLWGDLDKTDQFYDIAAMPDDGFVAVGLSYGFTSVSGGIAVARFDRNGNELWARIWDSSNYDVASSVLADTSGNIYLAGASNGFRADDETDAIILKLSPSGDLLWEYRYTNLDTTYATSMSFNGDDSLLINCWADSYFNLRSIGLLELDLDGELLDETILEFAGIVHTTDITSDRNGNIYLSAYFKGNMVNYDQCLLTKLSPTKDVLWARIWTHEDEAKAWSIQLRYPVLFGNPDVLIAGNSTVDDTSHPLLTRLNPDGSLDSAFSWFNANGFFIGDINHGPHGSILLSGSATANSVSYTTISPAVLNTSHTSPPGTSTRQSISGVFTEISGMLFSPSVVIDQPKESGKGDCFVGCYYPEDL
jgi:hypothetical protein